MKRLKKICSLTLLLCSSLAMSQEQSCFDFIKEPLRICLNDFGTNLNSSQILIFDLDRDILLADFEGRVDRDIEACENCSSRLKQLLSKASNMTLLQKISKGHTSFDTVRLQGFQDKKYNREFGLVVIGGIEYPYTWAKSSSLRKVAMFH